MMAFSLYTARAKHNAQTATGKEHQQYNDYNDGNNIFAYIRMKKTLHHISTSLLIINMNATLIGR